MMRSASASGIRSASSRPAPIRRAASAASLHSPPSSCRGTKASISSREADLDRIEALAEEMQGLPDRGDSYAVYDRFAALDQEFHDTLAAASGHTLLTAAVERLHTQMLCRVELWSWGGSPRSLGAVRCGAVRCGGVGRGG